MNFKLITSTALLSAAFLSTAQAQTIERKSIFRYAFEQSDLIQFDTQWGGYAIDFEIEGTYLGTNPWADLYLFLYDDKDFTHPSYGIDLPATGGTIALSVPYEWIGQHPLGWADGIGSLEVFASDGAITLNKLSFRIAGPSVGYFKDVPLSAVPEPSALAYLLGGLMSMGQIFHRQRKK